MVTVKVSSKGQIAIPKAIREQLSLKAGVEMSIDVQGQTLIMRRASSTYPDWRTLRGTSRGAGLLEARAEQRRRELADEDVKNR